MTRVDAASDLGEDAQLAVLIRPKLVDLAAGQHEGGVNFGPL